MKVGIIGGGAAGFFAGINCKIQYPDAVVEILEKSNKVLSKVKISGGGRCNVTHHCFSRADLTKYYPRGGKSLKKAFGIFYTADTVEWFAQRGVELKSEEDGRMFPITNSSETIINCFKREIEKLGVELKMSQHILQIIPTNPGFDLVIGEDVVHYDKLIIATGGGTKVESFSWLTELGLEIESPVPSLFTFNMPSSDILSLQGVVAPNAIVKIKGSKLMQEGPLLITHWGMSGPAILKLSAWGARDFANANYQFEVLVNWCGISNEELIRSTLQGAIDEHPKKKIGNTNPFNIPNRLWEYLLLKVEIPLDTICMDVSKKPKNQLINCLANDTFQVDGKTTFKEEFVTCGGISLNEINITSMQSKKIPGLYFAGEILDIDGVTGGFNFQSAWTTGYIASMLKDV